MPTFSEYGGWLVAVLTIIGTVVVGLWPKKGSLEHQLIDQLQEQVDKLTSRVDGLEEAARSREEYVRRLERRDRAWQEHITTARIGLTAGTVPPWPAPPAILEEEL